MTRAEAEAHGGDIETLYLLDAGCTACASPLFHWEREVGLCRTHGTAGLTFHAGAMLPLLDGTQQQEPLYRYDRLTELRDLGSVLPPLPTRGASVRVKHHVVVVPRIALTDAPDLLLPGGEIDPVARQSTGRDKHFRIVER